MEIVHLYIEKGKQKFSTDRLIIIRRYYIDLRVFFSYLNLHHKAY